jgi:hypothetical protein
MLLLMSGSIYLYRAVDKRAKVESYLAIPADVRLGKTEDPAKGYTLAPTRSWR